MIQKQSGEFIKLTIAFLTGLPALLTALPSLLMERDKVHVRDTFTARRRQEFSQQGRFCLIRSRGSEKKKPVIGRTLRKTKENFPGKAEINLQ